jgi:hypothetical protein
LLGMTSLARPKPVPASAPATDFSAERGMRFRSLWFMYVFQGNGGY